MNFNEIVNYFLGGVDINFLIAFYVMAIIGVFLSFLLHFSKKKKKRKETGTEKKFSWWFLFLDNAVRFTTSVICLFVIVRFYSKLQLPVELDMFLAFTCGMTIDRLIIFVRKKTSINIFQYSKNETERK